MKFELFLNQLSESQTYLGKDNNVEKLNCIGKCNPYNASRIENKAVDVSRIENLYSVIKRWKLRKEDFGYIVYDTNNGRIYLTDDAGNKFLSNCMETTNFSGFQNLINKENNSSNINRIQSICI